MWFVLAQTVPSPTVITLDPTTITLVGGMVVTIISAIVSGTVAVITAIRMGQVHKAQDVMAASVNTLSKDTEAIKGHVNSEKTASEGREAALRNEIHMLREIVADKKATAALLAQARVTEKETRSGGSVGATGVAGPQGATGVAGPQGAAGAAGPTGTTGVAGAAGATGAIGESGSTGQQGERGEIGPTATDLLAEGPIVKSLAEIDRHTAAIEKNTAKTDATISDMQRDQQ